MVVLMVLIGQFGLLVVTPAVPIWLACMLVLRQWRAARVPFGMLCGYVAAMAIVWQFVPADWSHSFWTTVRAAFDAKTFGHPVEHYAQSILITMLSAAVVGAAAGGTIGGLTARRRAA